MPLVLIRIDEAGEWPCVFDDEEDILLVDDDARWRYVATVETRGEARAVCHAWPRRRAGRS